MWRTFLATRAFFDTFSSSTGSSWWEVAGPLRNLSSSIWSAGFSSYVAEVNFVLFGSRSIELPLVSSGRASESATTPRFASSADAVRRLSSQASWYDWHLRVCDLPRTESFMPGIKAFYRFLTRRLRLWVIPRALLVLAFRVRDLQAEVLWESLPVSLLSTSLHLDVKP